MGDKLYDIYQREITLTKEQQSCLQYTGSRTLMVKGYAGAGKSLLLMAKAKKCESEYGPDAKRKVAIFTFQNTLVSYMQEFFQNNAKNKELTYVSTVNGYIQEVYQTLAKRGEVPFLTCPRADRFGKEQRLKNVEKALGRHARRYGKHRFHTLPYEFWLEEFDWMKDMDIWVDDRDKYLAYKRKGRGGQYRFSQSDYITAFQIYQTYCAYLHENRWADWVDHEMFISRHSDLIPEDKKFDYILIDEAQDLSLAQMKALTVLSKKEIVVALDANQRIFGRSWTPKQLGIETTTKKLTKSMRTTKEIEALAEAVRSKNDVYLNEDDITLRAIPERSGALPKLIHVDKAADEKKQVIKLVDLYRKANPKATIGIIAAKNTQIKTYSSWLADAGIYHEQVQKNSTFSMAKPGVKVTSAFAAKGLEFDIVIIPMFAEGYFPYKHECSDQEEYEQYMIKMRNLVYVSMTRARSYLYITWWGNGGSRFISDMEKSLYAFDGTPFKIKEHRFVPAVQEEAVPVEKTEEKKKTSSELVEYLEKHHIKMIDLRDEGGPLWVLGGRELTPILNGTKTNFKAIWLYSQSGNAATKYKSGWYTRCTK